MDKEAIIKKLEREFQNKINIESELHKGELKEKDKEIKNLKKEIEKLKAEKAEKELKKLKGSSDEDDDDPSDKDKKAPDLSSADIFAMVGAQVHEDDVEEDNGWTSSKKDAQKSRRKFVTWITSMTEEKMAKIFKERITLTKKGTIAANRRAIMYGIGIVHSYSAHYGSHANPPIVIHLTIQ